MISMYSYVNESFFSSLTYFIFKILIIIYDKYLLYDILNNLMRILLNIFWIDHYLVFLTLITQNQIIFSIKNFYT